MVVEAEVTDSSEAAAPTEQSFMFTGRAVTLISFQHRLITFGMANGYSLLPGAYPVHREGWGQQDASTSHMLTNAGSLELLPQQQHDGLQLFVFWASLIIFLYHL